MTSRTLVESFYDENAEAKEHRLDHGRLEFEVTLRVINDCILGRSSQERIKILDMGGGPGKYAIKLATHRHQVTLNDLSQQSLAIAEDKARRAGIQLEDVIHANALEMMQHVQPSSFDIVLCLGPLYHLLLADDRAKVIANSIATRRPGAYIILAYVTIYAHLRDVARRDPRRLSKESGLYESYLSDGRYIRRPNNESFHICPVDLESEMQPFQDVVKIEKMISCEGFLGSDTARGFATLDEEEMQKWVDAVMMSAQETETRNSADHILIVLRKL